MGVIRRVEMGVSSGGGGGEFVLPTRASIIEIKNCSEMDNEIE